MNFWLQTKLYECHLCHAKYLHDKAREHQLYRCPERAAIVQGDGGRPVPTTMSGGRVRPPTLGMDAPILLNGK